MPGQSHNRGPTSRQNALASTKAPKRYIPGELKTTMIQGGRVVKVGDSREARNRPLNPAKGE